MGSMPLNIIAVGVRERNHSAVQLESTNSVGSNTITLQRGGSIIQKGDGRLLIRWADLPEWCKDNKYIQTGFRPISNSYTECLKSMSYIHNETGNIYTHLFAAFWMMSLATWYYQYAKEHYPQANKDDLMVFSLFFLGGISCFTLSTIYHALASHSHSTHHFCLKLDFLGIIVVTTGCLPPGLWYTFPCLSRKTKLTWITFDLLAQFLAATFVLFVKKFRTPSWRPFRGLLFSFMASSAFYPIILAIYQIGWKKASAEYGASFYVLTIFIYLSSVAIYITQFPEAWKPGRFDIWGHSHQVFHIGMAIGLTTHFYAFVTAVDQFYSVKGGSC